MFVHRHTFVLRFSLAFVKILWLWLPLLLLLGCKKQAPAPPVDPTATLPPATQIGQRTFGCLVNGQPWTPAGNPFTGPLFEAQYYGRHLMVLAHRNTISNGVTSRESISLDLDNLTTTGTFRLVRRDTSFVRYDNFTATCQYYSDKAHPATVEVTRFDAVNRIVAGRFSFTLETPGCGRVTVSDGRFDTRF